MNTLIEELKWRGLLQDIIPGTEEQLNKESTSGYIGFDPTSDSLHIGSLVPIVLLIHLQKAGHKPIALVGGATGMVGDPSGKSEERNMLDKDTLAHNVACIEKQLQKFLDFNTSNPHAARIVNNFEWFKKFTFLDFIRDVGKHITVNYMLSKDSVQKRLESGMSFTEFTYQLVQGFDFYHLYTSQQVKLQMGGSDQWGNIVTGTELIRRKVGGEAFAFTAPLLKKADGGKFGKTESGNIWLDPSKTSPYQFYQFWLNTSDDDAANYIKIFTFLSKDDIENLLQEHALAPHQRLLQKTLAKEVTTLVHSADDVEFAVMASQILFGDNTAEALRTLNQQQLAEIVSGVPSTLITHEALTAGLGLLDVLVESKLLPSKGEARKMIQSGAISINKQKIDAIDKLLTEQDLLANKYLLLQKGKKHYHFLIVSTP
jgi:tyrosyl-tRNA synthetase (EC 6.1.1.1)